MSKQNKFVHFNLFAYISTYEDNAQTGFCAYNVYTVK